MHFRPGNVFPGMWLRETSIWGNVFSENGESDFPGNDCKPGFPHPSLHPWVKLAWKSRLLYAKCHPISATCPPAEQKKRHLSNLNSGLMCCACPVGKIY